MLTAKEAAALYLKTDHAGDMGALSGPLKFRTSGPELHFFLSRG